MAFKQNSKKPTRSSSLPTLDLHGFTTDKVVDKLDQFIHKHLKAGTPRVKVMPGKGSGAVKKTVVEYLKLGGFPFQAETLPNGKKNPGVLIVFTGD